jgi:hypothetical protein
VAVKKPSHTNRCPHPFIDHRGRGDFLASYKVKRPSFLRFLFLEVLKKKDIKNQKLKNYNPNCPNISEFTNNPNNMN